MKRPLLLFILSIVLSTSASSIAFSAETNNISTIGNNITENIILSNNSGNTITEFAQPYHEKSVIGGVIFGALGLTSILVPGTCGWGNFYAGDYLGFAILNLGGSILTIMTYIDAARAYNSFLSSGVSYQEASVIGYIGVIGSFAFGVASVVMGGTSVDKYNYTRGYNPNPCRNLTDKNAFPEKPYGIDYRRSFPIIGLIVPGLPQLQAGDTLWGTIDIAGFVTGAGLFVVSEFLFDNAVTNYIKATNSTDATTYYNQMTAFKITAYAGVGLWALSAVWSVVHAAFFGQSSSMTYNDGLEPLNIAMDYKGNFSVFLSWRF